MKNRTDQLTKASWKTKVPEKSIVHISLFLTWSIIMPNRLSHFKSIFYAPWKRHRTRGFNQRFSDVFRSYKNVTLTWNESTKFSDHICGKATMGLSWGCHRHGERISNKTYKPSKNVSLRSCRSSLLDRSFFVFNNGVFAFPSPRPLAWPPALAPNLYLPVLASNLCLPTLVPNLYLTALAPNLYLLDLAPNLCLAALAPNLYLLALASNLLFTSSGQDFTTTTTATCTITITTIINTTTTTTTSTTRENNNKRCLRGNKIHIK